MTMFYVPHGSMLAHDLARIAAETDVVAWLEQNRADVLEMMAQVNDETRFRQLQGTAVTLKSLIIAFKAGD